MAISFNNIPTNTRTPGVYTEVDNSRALQGLVANPHKALILAQKTSAGTAETDTLLALTKDNLADGYFGVGSLGARMANIFKANNPNTELWAMVLSDDAGGVAASGTIQFSIALSATGGSVSGTGEVVKLLVNGSKAYLTLTSAWSVTDVNSAMQTLISANLNLPVYASTNATSALNLVAKNNGEPGNYIDFRLNYFTGESNPKAFGDSATITAMANGATNPDITDAWAVIDNEQFHYIIQPYFDTTNLTALETELGDRFGPLENKQGHAFLGYRGTTASCTTIGNSRNSPYNTIMGAYDSPTDPAEWGAALGAQAAFNLNNDPARPLHTLALKNVLAPPSENRFSQTERNTLLFDGIGTFTVRNDGTVQIERSITTYQTNALGITDPSYLDIQTLATLSEIRYQYGARMATRFIAPRFKLADDTFPVQPGSNVATPKTVKREILALFTLLRDRGLIENLAEFEENLIVERNTTDVNRVDVLMPPDLVNQFRVLAGVIQFLL